MIWSGEVIHMGWKPRAYLFKGFLSQEEADKLKAHGEGRLTKSQVVDSKTGHSKSSEVRTSSGTFLSRGMDDFIDAVEDRIATVSMIPKDHGEGLQILKYVDGQKYDPRTSLHISFLFFAKNRLCRTFIYSRLHRVKEDDEEETSFLWLLFSPLCRL